MADGRRHRHGASKPSPPLSPDQEDDSDQEEHLSSPLSPDQEEHSSSPLSPAEEEEDMPDIRPRRPAEVPAVEHDGDEHPQQASCFFEAGDRVELLRWHPDYGYAWYPAAVEGVLDPDTCTYIVQKESMVGGKVCLDEDYQEQGLDNVRPKVVESEFMLDLRPGAEVEAYCDGVWAIGVVLAAVGGLQYEVAIGDGIEQRREIKEMTDLRPRYKWNWNRMEWSVVASSSSQSVSVKRPRSPVKEVSDDCEHSYDSENFATKKSRKEGQQLEIMPDGSEHALVTKESNVSGNLICVLTKKVTTRRKKLKFHIKKGLEEQCHQHGSLDATTMQLSTMGIDCSLLNEGLTDTINSTCQGTRNEDEAAIQIPFVKRLLAWLTFEEMEVFKKMPQRPHFGPLQKDSPGLREGNALRLMAWFANVVESMRKSSIEDTDESFEEKNNILSLLKHNGFSVDKLQTCLNKLIEMKSEYARHIKEKDTVQNQKLLKETSRSRVNSTLVRKMDDIFNLEKILGQLHQEVQQLEEENKLGEAELSGLEEAESMIDKACYDIKEEFVNTLADHLG